MLKCLKDMSSWQDVTYEEEEIRRIAREASGSSEERYKSAVDVVYYDGMYGPIAPYEFEEGGEYFGEFKDFAEAHAIVRAAIEATYPDYEYCDFDYAMDVCGECDNCKMTLDHKENCFEVQDCTHVIGNLNLCENPPPNCIVEGRTIRDEMFSWYKKIYGGF